MPYGQGNWFHSRVASSENEIKRIVQLFEESKAYAGLIWTSSDSRSARFAMEIGVQSSQMRTKITAFIRFGFIKKDNVCPLQWTKMCEIWRSLVLNENENLALYADVIKELMLASSLAFYSFDKKGFASNPTQNYRPVFDLLKNLDNNGFISKQNIENLIGRRISGSNYSYWKTDLKNAGILEEVQGGFKLTNKFPELFSAITTRTLPTNLTNEEWEKIQNNGLDSKNPYVDAILSEMEKITGQIFDIEGSLPLAQKQIVTKMVEYTSSKEESEIEDKNYKIPDTYGKVRIRRKQSAWSNKVRKGYNFKCCIPECDIDLNEFLEAAHIKKYNEKEEGKGHRANPHNGLCLCPLCHLIFDKGYFTLSDDCKIIISPKLSSINSNRLKNVIKDSEGKQIKMPNKYHPDKEYIIFHQKNVFMK